MLIRNSLVRLLALILSVSFATACGGGNGPSTDGSLKLSVTSLSFSAVSGGSLPQTQIFSYSSSNPSATQILIGVPEGTTKPSWLSYGISGSQLWVGITSTSLSAGTYNATIRIATGTSRNSIVDIKDIPLTYVVTEATVASPSSLSFSAVKGELPAMQSFTLSKDGAVVTPLTTIELTSNWFDIVINGDAVEVTPNANAVALNQGSYGTNVRVTTSNDTVTVRVFYSVTSKKLTTSNMSTYIINSSTQLSQLSQDLTVSTNYIGTANWTASVDVPWLTLSTFSGDTSAANNVVSVGINTAQIGSLKNKYTSGAVINHSGVINLTSSTAGVTPISVNVVLNLDLPLIEYVAPYVAVTGSTDEIILRGSGFSAITNEVLNCGNQAATSYTVNSDIEMRATCPALIAGIYELELINVLAINRDHARLNVVDVVTYANEVIPTTGTKSKILYDPTRESIYIADTQNGIIERYKFDSTIAVGSKWVTSGSATALTGLSDIALSTDGSYLYAVKLNSNGQFSEINPDTLAIENNSGWGGYYGINSVVFLNAGEAIFTFNNGSSAVNAKRSQRNSAGSTYSPALVNAIGGSSRDGRRAVFASQDANPTGAVYYIDSADHPYLLSLDPLTLSGVMRNAANISSDRTGSKWVFDHTAVYSNVFALLGNLPATTQSSLLSHDGAFVYTVDSNGTVRKFDLSDFSEVGTGTALAGLPGSSPVMTMSHDGARIFIAGDQNLIIMAMP